MQRMMLTAMFMFTCHLSLSAADQAPPLPKDQAQIRDKYAALEAAVVAAQKKFQDTSNSIELTEAKTALKNYRDELTVTLVKPVTDWVAVVEGVDAGRKGAYTVHLRATLTSGYDGNIGFHAETHNEALIATLKTLQKGDVVTFSGKRDSEFKLHTLNVNHFVLSAIAAVKK